MYLSTEQLTMLNGVCPYFTMFPLQFPLRILQKRAKRGDTVLDPFCGRGTTNFAARLLGLGSLGVDSSPVATAITATKLARVSAQRKSCSKLEKYPDAHGGGRNPLRRVLGTGLSPRCPYRALSVKDNLAGKLFFRRPHRPARHRTGRVARSSTEDSTELLLQPKSANLCAKAGLCGQVLAGMRFASAEG